MTLILAPSIGQDVGIYVLVLYRLMVSHLSFSLGGLVGAAGWVISRYKVGEVCCVLKHQNLIHIGL